MPDPINILIFLFAASLPATYVFCVGHYMKDDVVETAKIAREPGQTNHTACGDVESVPARRQRRSAPATQTSWAGATLHGA